MIAGLRGTVEGRTQDGLLVSVGGVVFQVQVPAGLIAASEQQGERIDLFTHLYMREDGVALYGFASQQELEIFRLLLGVSGVGPRGALALISHLGVARLSTAIAHEQGGVLSSAPGIGKRTAARLILELKGKPLLDTAALGPEDVGDAATQTLAALTGLGYSSVEAQEAWRALAPEQRGSVEAALRACLGYLSERR